MSLIEVIFAFGVLLFIGFAFRTLESKCLSGLKRLKASFSKFKQEFDWTAEDLAACVHTKKIVIPQRQILVCSLAGKPLSISFLTQREQ